MRTTLFALLLSLAFLSCNQEQKTEVKEDDSNSQAMVDMTRQIYKAMETGDRATLERLIADDATDHGGSADGGDAKRPEIINMLSDVHKHIDNLKIDIEEVAASNDKTFALVKMSGKTNKAIWGMPANHDMGSRSVDLLKFRDGKITDHWGFMEQTEVTAMMQQFAPKATTDTSTNR